MNVVLRKKRIFSTSDLAEFYAVLGDISTALDWPERAVRGGDAASKDACVTSRAADDPT
jgi:hypothetical protein